MIEHRWRDITGPSVADDTNWRADRTLPTFGDGAPASLEAGDIKPLAPRKSSIMAMFEVFDGQGASDTPVSPTPVVTATLEVVTMFKDQAGNVLYEVGPAVVALANQRKAIEVESSAQGLSWIRLSNLAGALPNPGSIRVYADEDLSA